MEIFQHFYERHPAPHITENEAEKDSRPKMPNSQCQWPALAAAVPKTVPIMTDP